MNLPANPPQQLRDLCIAASLGTDRAPGHTPRSLLHGASMLELASRAGAVPESAADDLPMCEPESQPLASDAACAVARSALEMGDVPVMLEWLAAATRRGVRADGFTLAGLITRPQHYRPFLARMEPVLGARGRWLLNLHPAWRAIRTKPLTPAEEVTLWETGKLGERKELLTQVRRRDPAAGLALVQSTWKSDDAEQRAAFVEILRQQAHAADEPFFDLAMKDRSGAVRTQVVLALGAIPGSKLRRRMNLRACGMIEVAKGRTSPRLSINPPAKLTDELEEDGIIKQHGVGVRASMVRQIISLTDLPELAAHCECSPREMLKQLEKDDYFADLLAGLCAAATQSRDESWCLAVGPYLPVLKQLDRQLLMGFWSAIPIDMSERLRLNAASASGLEPGDRWRFAVDSHHPWSESYSRAIIEVLSGVPLDQRDWMTVDGLVYAAARLVWPSAGEAFITMIQSLSPAGDAPSSLARSIERVRLRAQIHKEFPS